MATVNRPLSPHLQVYRPQLTSMLSILHRGTGIALSAGTLLLTWWLVAAASGPGPYAGVHGFLGSPVGVILLIGWAFSFFYHLLNGIRHLVWDTGFGLDIPNVYASGWAVAGGSVVLTLVAVVAGFLTRGA